MDRAMVQANHLCDYLPHSETRDFTLIFEDGALEVDKILLLALSNIRHDLAECDLLITESRLEVGHHVVSLLTTGQTEVVGTEMKDDIEFLLSALQIDINLYLVNTSIDITVTQDFEILDSITNIETIESTIREVDIGWIETVETIETNICDIGDFTDTEPTNTNIIITAAIEAEKQEDSPPSKKKPDKIVYQCDISPCNLIFEGITQFRKHTNDVHNVRPLACPEKNKGCKFRADDQGKMETHMRGVHKDLYSENVTCEFCSRAFASKSYLKSHIRRMHRQRPAEREKVCPYCGESKLQLNDHIMRAHKQKRFFCDLCPKSFKTSVQRRIHRNVHTGFRPYTCQTCNQTFARLHHRKIHLEKSGHTAGPVLKPDDHVDYRKTRDPHRETETELEMEIVTETETVISQDLLSFVDSSQEILEASEQLKREFGVNCAEIIENINFSSGVLDFD